MKVEMLKSQEAAIEDHLRRSEATTQPREPEQQDLTALEASQASREHDEVVRIFG